MSTISTHVLDISLGKPAQGIRVTLEQGADILATGVTDADGRVPELKAGTSQALWLTLITPDNLKPALYTSSITCKASGLEKTIPYFRRLVEEQGAVARAM